MEHIPMSERCIHVVNELTLKCIKCGSPWEIAKNDPRPYDVVIREKNRNGKQYQS